MPEFLSGKVDAISEAEGSDSALDVFLLSCSADRNETVGHFDDSITTRPVVRTSCSHPGAVSGWSSKFDLQMATAAQGVGRLPSLLSLGIA